MRGRELTTTPLLVLVLMLISSNIKKRNECLSKKFGEGMRRKARRQLRRNGSVNKK